MNIEDIKNIDWFDISDIELEDLVTVINDKISMREQIERIKEYRSKTIPAFDELHKLCSEIYPYDKINKVFKLGIAHVLSIIKNEFYKDFDQRGKEIIDAILNVENCDDDIKEYLNKFIKT